MSPITETMDGNEAVASVAYRTNEVIAIYPITPSSPMGESSDAWASEGKPNVWGTAPSVIEMQSEAGAAGAVHGALQTGSLTTTFTASQGLLLMIPVMFKLAGELTPTVFHVAARSVAAHALSIFGDHSDVMAARGTGFALLCSGSVQEAQDFALISQAATLESRIPFLHFFDGFRTSHEVSKIEVLPDDDLRSLIDEDLILAHRARALSPEHPVVRGTAQNPDVFFQGREASNRFYLACPGIVQKAMDRFRELTGRAYRLYDYHGAPDADRVIVLMGSGAETVHETVDHLLAQGEKVGVLKVRLFRPFDVRRFMEALPPTVRSVAVLDRTKEPGSGGEPLYLDAVNALEEARQGGWSFESPRLPRIIGGRYGLSSKEFTPAMAKAVFEHLAQPDLKNHFTIGIEDDVTHTSLPFDADFSIEPESVYRAVFYGLGSDGTVGANKNSIKIIGEKTGNFAQGYFVYDSRKAGAITISHLRFGPASIRSSHLITRANFLGCHQHHFLDRYDMLKSLVPGGTFLLNTPYPSDKVWDTLPLEVQETVVRKRLRFYVIDAYKVAGESGMGRHINTVMQVCFFAISGILPRDEAIGAIKESIQKTYGRKGDEIVQMNIRAVDGTLAHLHEVRVPEGGTSTRRMIPPVPDEAPAFVREVIGPIIAGEGDALPVSRVPIDGTFPSATGRWEKRNIAIEIPAWEPGTCIECGKCAFVCPHSVIRIKVVEPGELAGAPASLLSKDARDREWEDMKYIIQVSPEDCTGCGICVDVCPARNKSQARLKALNMTDKAPILERERANWDFFAALPETDRRKVRVNTIRQQQVQQPLFEFSGACPGCGETPYLKLLTQLWGDRLLVANATGCSSIYGANLPTTPWSVNREGRGPAWANSLFEDNAEFGLGFRVSIDKQAEAARQLVALAAGAIGEELAKAILEAVQEDEADIHEQRARVEILKQKLAGMGTPEAKRLLGLVDALVRKSIWIVGGDGWAYDIGFGGLDHVLASGRNVNILVMDTEVYSNTGGQMSKATPRGAVAKFATSGKATGKKDLGLIAMTYGNVYIARVAMGAKDEHTLRAFLEAEAYPGPSLIIAYAHCIAHGINMTTGMKNQKAAVDSGQWPLYRYHPCRAAKGENPLQLDSGPPKMPVSRYMAMENRFRMLGMTDPGAAKRLAQEAQEEVRQRWALYEHLAARKFSSNGASPEAGRPAAKAGEEAEG
ncbi:MAG: pyruvate:ferredoxin (flavodoxin) oxidoreductase [Candidatus Tectomicrobia bacterium]|uniref:Pyruvate:ferredoxin (Flavodoxin) oxidoreductase n=1 Tax=Tectimicrobiota bacterium TaxID=2528274 RepID=A0A932MRH3_UNCTE|nr:pyruvate:ferredoxin (flavodoxin) oxidoreductase [Candidatus Tectomicrobia bacterium]